MIEARHIYKSFGDKEVLRDISTVFEDGKTNLIIGQSGSGKDRPDAYPRRTADTHQRVMCSTMAETSTACQRGRG